MFINDGNYEIYSSEAIYTIDENGEIASLPISEVNDINIIRVYFDSPENEKFSIDIRLNKEITIVPVLSAILFRGFDTANKYYTMYNRDPKAFIDKCLKIQESNVELIEISKEMCQNIDSGLYSSDSFDKYLDEESLNKFNEEMRYLLNDHSLAFRKLKNISDNVFVCEIFDSYLSVHKELVSLMNENFFEENKFIFEIGGVIESEGKYYLEVDHMLINVSVMYRTILNSQILMYTRLNKYPLTKTKTHAMNYRLSYKNGEMSHFDGFNNYFSMRNSYISSVREKEQQKEIAKKVASQLLNLAWGNKETLFGIAKKLITNNKSIDKSFNDQVVDKVISMLNDEGYDCKKA